MSSLVMLLYKEKANIKFLILSELKELMIIIILTSHCIYGADADLIMLSLSINEPNFFVIRESLSDKCKK